MSPYRRDTLSRILGETERRERRDLFGGTDVRTNVPCPCPPPNTPCDNLAPDEFEFESCTVCGTGRVQGRSSDILSLVSRGLSGGDRVSYSFLAHVVDCGQAGTPITCCGNNRIGKIHSGLLRSIDSFSQAVLNSDFEVIVGSALVVGNELEVEASSGTYALLRHLGVPGRDEVSVQATMRKNPYGGQQYWETASPGLAGRMTASGSDFYAGLAGHPDGGLFVSQLRGRVFKYAPSTELAFGTVSFDTGPGKLVRVRFYTKDSFQRLTIAEDAVQNVQTTNADYNAVDGFVGIYARNPTSVLDRRIRVIDFRVCESDIVTILDVPDGWRVQIQHDRFAQSGWATTQSVGTDIAMDLGGATFDDPTPVQAGKAALFPWNRLLIWNPSADVGSPDFLGYTCEPAEGINGGDIYQFFPAGDCSTAPPPGFEAFSTIALNWLDGAESVISPNADGVSVEPVGSGSFTDQLVSVNSIIIPTNAVSFQFIQFKTGPSNAQGCASLLQFNLGTVPCAFQSPGAAGLTLDQVMDGESFRRLEAGSASAVGQVTRVAGQVEFPGQVITGDTLIMNDGQVRRGASPNLAPQNAHGPQTTIVSASEVSFDYQDLDLALLGIPESAEITVKVQVRALGS